MEKKSCLKNNEKFICENCDYNTSKKSSYDKHTATLKHINRTQIEQKSCSLGFVCKKCNKMYKARNSLWYHEQKCNVIPDPSVTNETILEILINENKDFKNLMVEMMKNNTDLQNKMLDICKNGNGNITGNTINSHNKSFNMQFFLNEQCKDAMNIKEFIDSFQLQLSDLERVGQLGYVDGISDIIIKKLNEMDIYKRPIHCSDTKRDIMYVRADNVWEKETNSHDRVRLLVRQVTHKNIKLLPLWTEEYPQAKDIHHSLNDTYIGMVGQAMGGRGDIEENENKIIKRIAKTVYIDKYQQL